MSNVNPMTISVVGQVFGSGPVSLLDPVYIFKGKLQARATRDKFHDAVDLRFLEGHFRDELRQRKREFSLDQVGLAMNRSPELEHLFARLSLDLDAATDHVTTLDPKNLPRPQPGDVQKGLLASA